MAIKVSQGFERTGSEPIDKVFVLTKSEMKSIADGQMPDKYFTVCQDDGKLYLYDKENTVDEQTGKFRILEGSGGGSGIPIGGTTGQVLAKKSDTDRDVEWKTVEGTGIVDTEMSSSSVNAVQNKVIKEYVDAKEPDAITNQEIDTIIFG